MAVYTPVHPQDLDAFVKQYAIGAVVALKEIAEGVENSNFLLETTQERFILTLYEKRVNPADLPFFIGLMDHLAARGIACPLPVHDKHGNALNTLCGRPAAMVSFLHGASVALPDVAHCAQLGTALAQFHAAGQDFTGYRANALSVEGWAKLAAQAKGREEDVYAGLGILIADALEGLVQNWPQHLPTGIIHADMFPDNVFFQNNQLSGIIDFYFACSDALAYDLAICLNAWCFEPDRRYNPAKGAALLGAYHAQRPLNLDEQAAFPVLAKGAALRFLLTRLVDWLNVPPNALVRPHDPVDYVKRLQFHNTASALNDYGWQP